MPRSKLKKEVKNLYSENCNTFLKEIKDTKKWRDISCSWIRRVNIVKIAILLKNNKQVHCSPQSFNGILQRNRTNNKNLNGITKNSEHKILERLWRKRNPWWEFRLF